MKESRSDDRWSATPASVANPQLSRVLVSNDASDLLHELCGKDGNRFHARSAVGLAALPAGIAVCGCH